MTVKINKIVVATDGSENSKNAVEWGVAMAKVNNAELTAVYVIPDSGATLAMRGEMWAKGLRDHLHEEGNKAVKYVIDAGEKEGVKVGAKIIENKSSADGITDFARENDADIIIIGTKGKTGLEHIMLGSVAENVVRYSKKKVLVVP
ncbi:MAG: universal stress protein [Methanolobus sp.]|nr:universal stress protein [Methanolobus sp.]